MADEIQAAGSDVDSRKREIKQRLAAAEASGNADAAKELGDQLAAVNKEARKAEADRQRAVAAQARRAAAKDDPEAAKTAAPVGRAAPDKANTASK